MRQHQMTLVSDFYKQGHAEQFPKNTEFLASYMTPRMTRHKGEDKLIVFGVQGFTVDYLIERFNDTFFNVPVDLIIAEYEYVIKNTLTKDYCSSDKIRALHELGYLPIEVKALPEGTRCPIHVPCVEVTNTHKDFAWVVQFIESIMSCQLWYPMTVANQAYRYRMIVDKHYNKSVSDKVPHASAISEFGFRGAEGNEGAIMASAAFLTSFNKTATIEAILYLKDYYHGILEGGNTGAGMLSTEHAVMCSNFAIDGNETAFIKRLLGEIYPTGNISVVSDSYDYWNMVTNIMASKEVKDIIEGRDGTLFVRGDSGDPVDIICGELKGADYLTVDGLTEDGIADYFKTRAKEDYPWDESGVSRYKLRIGDTLYNVTCEHTYVTEDEDHNGGYIDEVEWVEFEKTEITPAMKGTVECLWDIFGGTVNEKGYKVLASCVKAIYGDSITPERAEKIYQRLEDKGFAANNVALGAGSFSMQCSEEDGILKPFTRDSYGIAIKATYMEADGKEIPVFKNPKTDTGKFKKSQKGMCYVYYDENGEITYKDGYTRSNIPADNLLRTVFKDGKLVTDESINDIRNRLHNGKF